MAEGEPKTVSQLEVVLLFCLAGGLACIVLHSLVTGWVWVPGQRWGPGGQGYWMNRDDDLGSYVLYLVIVSAATLGFLAMAVGRLRRFNEQTPRRHKP